MGWISGLGIELCIFANWQEFVLGLTDDLVSPSQAEWKIFSECG